WISTLSFSTVSFHWRTMMPSRTSWMATLCASGKPSNHTLSTTTGEVARDMPGNSTPYRADMPSTSTQPAGDVIAPSIVPWDNATDISDAAIEIGLAST